MAIEDLKEINRQKLEKIKYSKIGDCNVADYKETPDR